MQVDASLARSGRHRRQQGREYRRQCFRGFLLRLDIFQTRTQPRSFPLPRTTGIAVANTALPTSASSLLLTQVATFLAVSHDNRSAVPPKLAPEFRNCCNQAIALKFMDGHSGLQPTGGLPIRSRSISQTGASTASPLPPSVSPTSLCSPDR